MEKRALEEPCNGGDIKRPLNNLSDDGPLTQEDVVYFQKEAIWRQMNSYKEQNTVLRDQLQNYKNQFMEATKKLAVLNGWYGEIIRSLGGTAEGNLLDEESLQRRRESLLAIIGNKLEPNVESLNKSITLYETEKITLEKHIVVLQQNIQQLNDRVTRLTRECDRLSSKTLKRVFSQKEEEPVTEPEQGPGTETVDAQLVETLTMELDQLKASNKVLSSRLEEISQSMSNLKAENGTLTHRLENISDVDLRTCTKYQEVIKENELLTPQVVELSSMNEQLLVKTAFYEQERTKFKEETSAIFKHEHDALKVELEKTQNDLARIRAARDDLLSKNAILAAETKYSDFLKQLQATNELQKGQIECLQEKSKEENAELLSSENKGDIEHLLKQNKLLLRELHDMEEALKVQVSSNNLNKSAESDSLLNKLTIEKNKADQKYFASMRAKDSLSLETRSLKTTNQKQTELISNLKESEKIHLKKIDLLEVSIRELKIQDTKLVLENKDSKRQLERQNQDLQRLKQINETLEKSKKDLIQSLEQSCKEKNELVDSKVRLETKTSSLELLLSKYKSSNSANYIIEESEQQINALRAMTKCSVCSKNWKNVAIKVCGHTFCNDCAQERVAARMRRCPVCDQQFSANDVLQIHL